MELIKISSELAHLLAMLSLLNKIWKSRSVAGLSGHSQFLLALVFTTRFMDLFTAKLSPLFAFKILFLIASYTTVYFIFIKFRPTYDASTDVLRAEILLILVAGMATLVNHQFVLKEILFSFSVFLEAVAFIPQLYAISRTGEAETITCLYLLALGVYRVLALVDWLYRFYVEYSYDIIVVVAGFMQTGFYLDLVYLYLFKTKSVKESTLPV